MSYSLRPYQQKCADFVIKKLANYKEPILLNLSCAYGKCFDPETPVLMADGTIKSIKHIQVGEKVQSVDGANTVVGSHSGVAKRYKICPTHSDPFIVSQDHIMYCYNIKTGKYETLTIEKLTEKYCYKNGCVGDYRLVHSPIRQYTTKNLAIPPYILGLWLGDGTSCRGYSITTMDKAVVSAWQKFGLQQGLTIRKRIKKQGKNLASTYDLVRKQYKPNTANPIDILFQKYHLLDNKHIPLEYLTGDWQQRVELLAGIIDADGYFEQSGNCEITQKDLRFATQIAQLARGLGLATRITPKDVKWHDGRTLQYWRILLRGKQAWSELPLRVKTPTFPKRERDYSLECFKIEALSDGEYCGIQVDGDNLFLLADNTVVHNSWLLADVAKRSGLKTLILTISKELCDQDFAKLSVVMDGKNVGMYSASWGRKETEYITVATVQSAYKHPELWADYDLVIADECLDGECQVLTEQGWVKLCDYDGMMKIAQFHPDTQKIDFATPSRVVRKVSTDIWHFQNAKGFEFYATGGHRHLVKHRHRKNFQWVYDDEVLTSEQLSHSPNRWLYCCGKTTSRKATLIEKIGIMLEADGCVYDTLSNGVIKWKVEFSRHNKIKYAKQLLDAAGIKYVENHPTRKGWRERGWARPTKITFVMPEPTVNYKRFPDFIAFSDVPTDFVDELLKWDGHKSIEHARWTTTRQDEAEFVFTACRLCGHKCHLGVYKRDEHNHQDCYYLDFSQRLQDNTRMIGISTLKKHKIKTDCMMMYCVTVPTSFFLVRRNNTVWVSGNCDATFNLDGMFGELIDNKKVIGLSATCYGTVGSRKGRWFTTKLWTLHKIKSKKHGWFWKPIAWNTSENELLKEGYLCPIKYFSTPTECQLLKLTSNGSEFTVDSLNDWANHIYARAIEVMRGAERAGMCHSGIVFLPTVESCIALESLCKDLGINARAVHYKTPAKERDKIVQAHKEGRLVWLINQGVATRGFDSPRTDCMLCLRPTGSLRLWRQMLGRLLRTHPDKKVAYCLDLTENTKTWGRVEDLEMGKKKVNGFEQDTILLRGKDINGMEISKINLANVRKKTVENGGEQISRRKNYEF